MKPACVMIHFFNYLIIILMIFFCLKSHPFMHVYKRFVELFIATKNICICYPPSYDIKENIYKMICTYI